MSVGRVDPDTAMSWPLPKLVAWASIMGDQRARERLGKLYDVRAAYHADGKAIKKYTKELNPDG